MFNINISYNSIKLRNRYTISLIHDRQFTNNPYNRPNKYPLLSHIRHFNPSVDDKMGYMVLKFYAESPYFSYIEDRLLNNDFNHDGIQILLMLIRMILGYGYYGWSSEEMKTKYNELSVKVYSHLTSIEHDPHYISWHYTEKISYSHYQKKQRTLYIIANGILSDNNKEDESFGYPNYWKNKDLKFMTEFVEGEVDEQVPVTFNKDPKLPGVSANLDNKRRYSTSVVHESSKPHRIMLAPSSDFNINHVDWPDSLPTKITKDEDSIVFQYWYFLNFKDFNDLLHIILMLKKYNSSIWFDIIGIARKITQCESTRNEKSLQRILNFFGTFFDTKWLNKHICYRIQPELVDLMIVNKGKFGMNHYPIKVVVVSPIDIRMGLYEAMSFVDRHYKIMCSVFFDDDSIPALEIESMMGMRQTCYDELVKEDRMDEAYDFYNDCYEAWKEANGM